MVTCSALTVCDRSVVLILDDRPDLQLWGDCRSTHNLSMICYFKFSNRVSMSLNVYVVQWVLWFVMGDFSGVSATPRLIVQHILCTYTELFEILVYRQWVIFFGGYSNVLVLIVIRIIYMIAASMASEAQNNLSHNFTLPLQIWLALGRHWSYSRRYVFLHKNILSIIYFYYYI